MIGKAAIDELDKRIISFVQGDMPLVSRPFAGLARDLGISQEEVAARLRAMKKKGVLRRFGATLRHQQSGFLANVMVAWRVPEDRTDEVGNKLASFRHVSHCYWRKTCLGFTYNLFSMVHGKSKQQCRDIASQMAAAVEVDDYSLLFSLQELKKTSMQYY